MGYSAGALPEAFNVVVASHISMCDTCRAALAEYDAIGGALLDDEGVEMGEDSLAAALAMISEVQTPPAPRTPRPDAVLPSPIRSYVGGDLDAVKWRKIGGGVSQMILPTSKGATARLLHIPAGTEMPDHGHHGTELTLVLKGAFVDDEDRFAVGDVEVANEDLKHTPVAAEGDDCICIAACDAPLQFDGILPKIAQRIFRI